MKIHNQLILRMASLAAHHYSHMLDDNYHSLPYFYAKLDRKESYAWHSDWDFGDATGRYFKQNSLSNSILIIFNLVNLS